MLKRCGWTRIGTSSAASNLGARSTLGSTRPHRSVSKPQRRERARIVAPSPRQRDNRVRRRYTRTEIAWSACIALESSVTCPAAITASVRRVPLTRPAPPPVHCANARERCSASSSRDRERHGGKTRTGSFSLCSRRCQDMCRLIPHTARRTLHRHRAKCLLNRAHF